MLHTREAKRLPYKANFCVVILHRGMLQRIFAVQRARFKPHRGSSLSEGALYKFTCTPISLALWERWQPKADGEGHRLREA